jgi:methionine biosynthesis protein MetW
MTLPDNPSLHDNRNYDYSSYPEFEREEYHIIAEMVLSNSKVIDLGCGSGILLKKLKDEKNIKETGLEISQSGVDICKQKGLNVFQERIDEPLQFENDSYDYSICNVTIQMVNAPEILLKEMKRISKYQIISFPNFAFYKNRIELLLKGKMPESTLFNYKWYNTGHIHQFSIKDFKVLIEEIGLKIIDHKFVPANNGLKNFMMKISPNLFQQIPIFLTSK